ncbi:MAG: prepilin peptidase [Candidatus Omnitrophica bacterium]|nr:prepilin peptidase [Candidatus Omnitrophota bacterium]
MPILMSLILGAIAGSFLNVCIWRIPRGESVITPSSHCPKCLKPIRWYDNVPVWSILYLKGRCRDCQAPISPRYGWVEVSSAALFTVFYLKYGISVQGIVYLTMTLALLAQALIDLDHQIIPDEITLPGIALGVIASAFFPGLHGQEHWQGGLLHSLLGVALGGGILYAAGTAAEWVLKKEAMGGGDVKLLAMIGAVLGWPGVLWTLFCSSFLGSAVGIYLRLRRGDERIPFGPYLALGAVSYFFLGKNVVQIYSRFLIY